MATQANTVLQGNRASCYVLALRGKKISAAHRFSEATKPCAAYWLSELKRALCYALALRGKKLGILAISVEGSPEGCIAKGLIQVACPQGAYHRILRTPIVLVKKAASQYV